jgi:hypothetical protein
MSRWGEGDVGHDGWMCGGCGTVDVERWMMLSDVRMLCESYP